MKLERVNKAEEGELEPTFNRQMRVLSLISKDLEEEMISLEPEFGNINL